MKVAQRTHANGVDLTPPHHAFLWWIKPGDIVESMTAQATTLCTLLAVDR